MRCAARRPLRLRAEHPGGAVEARPGYRKQCVTPPLFDPALAPGAPTRARLPCPMHPAERHHLPACLQIQWWVCVSEVSVRGALLGDRTRYDFPAWLAWHSWPPRPWLMHLSAALRVFFKWQSRLQLALCSPTHTPTWRTQRTTPLCRRVYALRSYGDSRFAIAYTWR